MDPAQFDMVVNAIVWAIRHPIRSVAETGLKVLGLLFEASWFLIGFLGDNGE
jgi:hypothetical protein